MDLNYKILWIEDVASWQRATDRRLRRFLEDKNLELAVTTYRTPAALFAAHEEGRVDLNGHDLFLIDYKFGTEKTGGVLIDKIRKNEIYTDIIFYSSDGEQNLRDELARLQLEGVYCLDRRTGFNDKALRIIGASIKRVEDLNFLRGFVMAETSELDAKVLNILLHQFSGEGSLDRKQHEQAHAKAASYVNEHIKQNAKRLNRYDAAKLVSDLCDAHKRFRLLKYVAPTASPELKNKLDIDDYNEHVVKRRNMLAHVKAEDKDGQVVLVSAASGYEDEVFDHSLCNSIRAKIGYYRSVLNDLEEHLRTDGKKLDRE